MFNNISSAFSKLSAVVTGKPQEAAPVSGHNEAHTSPALVHEGGLQSLANKASPSSEHMAPRSALPLVSHQLAINPGNNDHNFKTALEGIEKNASDSIKLTQATGRANNAATAAESLEKMAKKGFDASKGLIG